jgi:hypothetical protein
MTPCRCPHGRGPFILEEDVNPNKNCCTVCTGDKTDNVWYVNGKCKLDELTYEQVWIVLLRNPNAKADLQRITSDPTLLQLAANTSLIQDEIESDQQAAKRINGPAPYFYAIKGNIAGSIL